VIGRQYGHIPHLWATMGTRGNPFTSARDFSHLAVEQALRRVTGTTEPVVFGHEGTSYFSSQFHGNTKWTVSDQFAWADDHGVLAMRYQGGGCNANARAVRHRPRDRRSPHLVDVHRPHLPGDVLQPGGLQPQHPADSR
jgi:hypothetical protein